MTLEKFTKGFRKIGIVCILFALMFGCVTKKKFNESQELLRTRILDETEIKWTNSVQNIKSELSESILSQFNETTKSFKESSSTNEKESTDVTVNIKAEEGKEKSATVGNTTVTSNGADISVKTTSNKSTDKKLETLNSEWSQKYSQLETSLKTIENKFNEKIEAQNNTIETLKSQLETKTKETNKKGLSFGVITFLIVLALLIILYMLYRLRNRFSAFNKIKGFFIPKK